MLVAQTHAHLQKNQHADFQLCKLAASAQGCIILNQGSVSSGCSVFVRLSTELLISSPITGNTVQVRKVGWDIDYNDSEAV